LPVVLEAVLSVGRLSSANGRLEFQLRADFDPITCLSLGQAALSYHGRIDTPNAVWAPLVWLFHFSRPWCESDFGSCKEGVTDDKDSLIEPAN
jgi:hypothetical protein